MSPVYWLGAQLKHLYANVCIEMTPSPLSANVITEWPHWGWLVPFFARKIYVQYEQKGNKTKTKSMKPKLLKTLNVNQIEPNHCFLG